MHTMNMPLMYSSRVVTGDLSSYCRAGKFATRCCGLGNRNRNLAALLTGKTLCPLRVSP